MDTIYKDLINNLSEFMPKKEFLFHILEYLKTKIPFERVVYHSTDREKKFFTVFFEYTLTETIQGYSYHLENIIPFEVLEGTFGERSKNVIAYNGNKYQAGFISDFLKQLSYPATSYAIFPVHIADDMSFHMALGFYSSQKNVFTEEHIETIALIRPLLERILIELFLNNSEPFLFIASVGPIATNFESQLRACPSMTKIMEKIDTIAKYDTTILIQGASGSGKELVAETLHSLSLRHSKPFVRVNCGALPESLLESELFGYEKGAFTGALQTRKGYFEQANNGTIYLDEIGELSKKAQTRLLRVLENKEIQRLGGERSFSLDIRIISATNKNLWKMVQENTFREDLYYRLNIFPIEIPSLFNRKEDIPVLIEYFYIFFVKKFQLSSPPVITYKTIRSLLEYAWPGNVRQLRAAIERGLLEAIGENKKEVDFSFLPLKDFSLKEKKNITTEEIVAMLQVAKGKIQGKNGAAELLGIHPATLRSRMQVLGIEFKKNMCK